MDETIGVKGGTNDRRRTTIIEQNKKKKDDKEEIRKLEKKVRKQQIFTLIKAIPIVVSGEVIKTIHDTAFGKKKADKEEEYSKWRIKEYDADNSKETTQETDFKKELKKRKVVTTPTGEKIVVYVTDYVYDESKDDEKKDDIEQDTKKEHPEKEKKFVFEEQKQKEEEKEEKKEKNKELIEEINKIDPEEFNYDEFEREYEYVDFSNLPEETQAKINKLKSRKIVSEYENQLKEIRYELRKAIFDYNVLFQEEEEIVLKKDAEIILDQLSNIIEKIETLKSKIRIDNLEQYDDNYIYFLIEGYLDEFRNKRIIDELKDSPLYISIVEKIEELDEQKGRLQDKVNNKKRFLEEKEEHFENLKSRYYSIEKVNNKLIEFQKEQDDLLESIKIKVANAKTETEKVQTEFVGLDRQSRKLLRLMSFQMFLPGPKYARGLASSVAAYMYFMNNVFKPNTKTKKYKVITVKDYSGEIKNSIEEIDKSIDLLGKTSNQIDKMISEIYEKYHDYFGVVKECDQMMSNLRRIKRDLDEKEYEMKRIKYEQEKELELNNQKVLSRGTYHVNDE